MAVDRHGSQLKRHHLSHLRHEQCSRSSLGTQRRRQMIGQQLTSAGKARHPVQVDISTRQIGHTLQRAQPAQPCWKCTSFHHGQCQALGCNRLGSAKALTDKGKAPGTSRCVQGLGCPAAEQAALWVKG